VQTTSQPASQLASASAQVATSATTPATRRDIRAIQSRLDKWELDHLRALSASLNNQLDEANTRAAEAESWAHTWWRNAESLQDELLLLAAETGNTVGLTQAGEIGVMLKTEPAAEATTGTPETTPPAPGQHWPAQGGTYIGIAPAEGDLPARHLVALDLPAGEEDKELTWQDACAWATAQGNGARLPTQLEALFAYTVAKAAFKPRLHWTGTQDDRLTAFCQSFDYGGSSWYDKDDELRCRAFRGLALQTFSPLQG